MHCTMEDCDGYVDETTKITLRTGCVGFSTAHPCNKCGRVHWPDGSAVFNRPGDLVYLKDEQIVHVSPPSDE